MHTLRYVLCVTAEIFRLKTECQALKDEEERQRELEKDLEAELASLNRDYDAILATKAAKPAERAMLKEKIIELDNLNTQKVRCHDLYLRRLPSVPCHYLTFSLWFYVYLCKLQ